MTGLNQITEELTRRTGLYVTARSVERIARAVLDTTDFWQIVDRADEIVPLVAEALRLFAEHNWVEFTADRVVVTEAGRHQFEQVWKVATRYDYRCGTCAGRGLDIGRLPEDVVARFLDIHQSRPEAIIDYDQGYVTPESTLARVAIAQMKGDLDGRRVLALGDDDLVSLAAALLGRPEQVVVVEIDRRLVDYIEAWARRLQAPIEVRQVDLSQPLPRDLVRAYDTFFTDPPESVIAFRAFVGRGIATLRGPGCAGYFGFTRREATLKKWYQIQTYLWEQRVVITDILHNYHAYVNWAYAPQTLAWRLAPVKAMPTEPWYRSSLYRIEALPEVRGEADTTFDIGAFSDAESSTT